MANEQISYQGPIVTWLDAKASGLKRYFSAEPCKHGHIAERFTANRNCCLCARRQFAEYSNRPNGSRTIKEYRERTKEKAAAGQKTWARANPEKCAAKAARWFQKFKDRERLKKKAYRDTHSELYKECSRRWREANQDKKRVCDQRNKALRKGAEGYFTADDVEKIRHAQKDKCACCKTKLNGGGQLDHIIPVARGGSNWPRNLQWLCDTCNRSKWHKVPEEFMRERGFLL
jgi:5-methylcytosine-specific restriction endonuclease McrA